ncbi:DUF2628 domain-containing protein [Clostridium sp. MCC353]|uniref:DUF2628 domain-containing protein n=1 Tax=Clostridium sp. MCC353 TaxID=2592646 RepID=UPI001C016F02|nr:DUF2628 domain-containing protein [Clostridium sp. MCC353]MBT9777009.1 DUF2628 domain-containing protein [Clostridium sp. MCC353]
MHAKLSNASGQVKEVKIGFSWTTFFFGFFVPLLRGDFVWALIMFFAAIIVGFFTAGIGGLVFNIIISAFYNKIYTQGLIKKGFSPASSADEQALRSKGYLV